MPKKPKKHELEKALKIALSALEFYQDPESYFAVAVMGDRPCGEFADDFGFVNKDWGWRPGQVARRAFKKVGKVVPDFQLGPKMYPKEPKERRDPFKEIKKAAKVVDKRTKAMKVVDAAHAAEYEAMGGNVDGNK